MENIINVIMNIWGILSLIAMSTLVFSQLVLLWVDHISPEIKKFNSKR